jgi:hypothetical protein
LGSITFQVIGDASVGTKTKTATFSNADINRLVTAAGSFVANPTPTTALEFWASAMIKKTIELVDDYEKAVANAARTPIVGT